MKMKNETLKQGYCKSSLKQIHSMVSFSFLPKGGQNEDYWRGGGKHIFMCKACGKLKGPRACSPGEVLISDLGLFLHKHNLPLMRH